MNSILNVCVRIQTSLCSMKTDEVVGRVACFAGFLQTIAAQSGARGVKSFLLHLKSAHKTL